MPGTGPGAGIQPQFAEPHEAVLTEPPARDTLVAGSRIRLGKSLIHLLDPMTELPPA
ncbi:hypothetical protein [Crossiella cryophila]|uniref:Uncharacterized protein n=1 Tax=Crossiella cryophila TaxID=43355 RepID=A0A7W7CD96_9PSEU|nr:hypothetical protein [Crossiella cryophila]MBB4679016.1 hypothetical protein [Crossiella cryophila]